MEDAETLVSKYTKEPPKTDVDAAKCITKIYRLVPVLRAPDFDREKTITLRNALFETMCDNYHALSQRVQLDNSQFKTPASGIYLVCAALTLVSGATPHRAPVFGGLPSRMGLIPTTRGGVSTTGDLTLAELLDAIWLLSARWNRMHIHEATELAELESYVTGLVHRSFFFVQTEITETGSKLDGLVESTASGAFRATPRLMRRFCESLCRPLATLRLLRIRAGRADVSDPHMDRRDLLRKNLQSRCADFQHMDSFHEQVRDFIEIGSVAPLDYALYTDKARDDKYVPHMMLTLARPPQFLAGRAFYINNLPLKKLVDIDESDVDAFKNVILTEHIGAIAVKMYGVNAAFENIGINIICNYLIMEPFLHAKFVYTERSKQPYLVMILGMMHVLYRGTIYYCSEGFEQAVCVWADMITGPMKGFLDLRSVTREISKLFQVVSGSHEKTKQASSWGNKISI